MLEDSGRTEEKDKIVRADIADARLSNRTFVRLIAKDRVFRKVDFKYSHFDVCYLRNCKFDSCDFTGCRFIGSNLQGSSFVGCKFDYATFERTIVDNDLLDSSCPGPENLRMRFARTLRTNFQQLGDAKSANKAITVELAASGEHLKKAWWSNESYYRHKYTWLKRAKAFAEWLEFQALDFIWGNGESTFKLIRFTVIVLSLMALIDVAASREPGLLKSYAQAFEAAPVAFLGIASPPWAPPYYLAIVMATRLIVVGFFLSIIIKRFNRR